jgi:hypothetical protein
MIQKALAGDQDCQKFVLARRAGWKTTTAIEATGRDGAPIEYRNLSDEELEARIEALLGGHAAGPARNEAKQELLALLDEKARRERARRRPSSNTRPAPTSGASSKAIPTVHFERTEKQQEQADAVHGTARHVLAYGGSRSGKTFGFCELIAERALQAPGSRHLIARLHNIDVRQAVMLDTWPNMMKRAFPDVAYHVNKADQFVTLGEGAEVWFGGLDDKDRVDKILGKEYATFYVNESSQVAYNTILTIRTRLAQACFRRDGSRLPLKGLYDLNPTGKSHWSHREFIEKVRPENGIRSSRKPRLRGHEPGRQSALAARISRRARQPAGAAAPAVPGRTISVGSPGCACGRSSGSKACGSTRARCRR